MTMPQVVRIYLSGSIKKGRSDERPDDHFWTAADEELIRQLITTDVMLLNPAKSPIRRSNFFVNYGCDLFLVQNSDVVLVDLRFEKGIGVGAELMFAQFADIPVVGWAPYDSYYRRTKVEDVFGEDLNDWVHPFVFGLCDFIAPDLFNACQHINEMWENNHFRKDTEKAPGKAIDEFTRLYGTRIINER